MLGLTKDEVAMVIAVLYTLVKNMPLDRASDPEYLLLIQTLSKFMSAFEEVCENDNACTPERPCGVCSEGLE